MKKKIIAFLIALLPFMLISMKRPGSALEPAAKKGRGSAPTCELLATPNDNIIKRIIQDIDSVEENGYIGIESLYLTNNQIIQAIERAARNGTTVRVFVQSNSQEKNPKLQADRAEIYEELKNNKINVTELPDLHAKRIVIAKNIPAKETETIVYLGSMNLTPISPDHYEIMIRCTDHQLFKESYGDQHRLGKAFYHTRKEQPVTFNSRRIIASSSPEARTAKNKIIQEFSSCTHPHDYLYFASLTLDDPEIVDSLKKAKQENAYKNIKVILDGSPWRKQSATNEQQKNYIKQLVDTGIDVYVFNKDGSQRTGTSTKLFHIKAILRVCNQKCLSLISTANFTKADNKSINHDLWEPCSLGLSEQLKKILDEAIQDSEKLSANDFPSHEPDKTPQEMGEKLLQLMKYPSDVKDNKNEILRLIEAGADLALTEPMFGSTALIKAIEYKDVQIVNELIKAGANVNQITTDPENSRSQNTALLRAASGGNSELVNVLIEAGIDPTLNFSDQWGNTPLFRAIQGKHLDIVKALLKAGADPNIPGDYRESDRPRSSFYWRAPGATPPIVQAVRTESFEIVKELLRYNIDINAKDRAGKTAFDYAARKPQILELLEMIKHAREGKF